MNQRRGQVGRNQIKVIVWKVNGLQISVDYEDEKEWILNTFEKNK